MPRSPHRLPRVSVVVPAHDEAESLGTCLQSLARGTWRGPLEVIVVDNASRDATADVAAAWGARVVREPRKGVAAARQRGFEAARGELVLSTDADTAVMPGWVTAYVRAFDREPGLAAASGPILPRHGTWFEWGLSLGVAGLFWAASGFRLAAVGGSNFAVRRRAFEHAGGFRRRLLSGEDVDLARRLKRLGRVRFVASARVRTSMRRFRVLGALSFAAHHAANWVRLNLLGRGGLPFADIRHEPRRARVGLASAGTLGCIGALVVLSILAFKPGATAFGPVVSEGAEPAGQKVIALTFDDGPNEPYTSEILAILVRQRVRGTFFVIGENCERYPDVVRRLAAAGEVIGNHTYRHSFAADLLDPRQADIGRAEDVIGRIAGVRPGLFRAPYGFKTPWELRGARRLGLTVVEWDDDPADYRDHSCREIVRRALAQARPGGIVLLHDGEAHAPGGDRSRTVCALPSIIAQLRLRGYRFVTVPELLAHPRGYAIVRATAHPPLRVRRPA